MVHNSRDEFKGFWRGNFSKDFNLTKIKFNIPIKAAPCKKKQTFKGLLFW